MQKNNKIVIIDYGMGNLNSVYNKFDKLAEYVTVSNNILEIEKADKLVLPGVGHFAKGMENIKRQNLLRVLEKKVFIQKVPILGICLGMQLFTKFSEEGFCEGLGWIDATTIKFKKNHNPYYKIPHMGWNNVTVRKGNEIVIEKDNDSFYFVHSYYVKVNSSADVWLTTEYDIVFTSGIHKENIWGVQFHPGKSHDDGSKLLKQFVSL